LANFAARLYDENGWRRKINVESCPRNQIQQKGSIAPVIGPFCHFCSRGPRIEPFDRTSSRSVGRVKVCYRTYTTGFKVYAVLEGR
jgi:hypothetical protein